MRYLVVDLREFPRVNLIAYVNGPRFAFIRAEWCWFCLSTRLEAFETFNTALDCRNSRKYISFWKMVLSLQLFGGDKGQRKHFLSATLVRNFSQIKELSCFYKISQKCHHSHRI